MKRISRMKVLKEKKTYKLRGFFRALLNNIANALFFCI
jgi:hypothetical protein